MRMLKIFLSYIILMVILITPSLAMQGIIKGTDIRIREEPNTDSQVLEYVSEEDQIEIIEKEENWYKITAKGVTGYIREDFIEISEETVNSEENEEESNQPTEQEPQEENNEESTQPQEGNIKVHIIPAISSSVIGTINTNTEYTIADTINKWTYIYNDNLSGWVVLDAINEDIIGQPQEEQIEQETEEEPQEELQEEQEQQEEQTQTSTENKKGYINVDSANLREEASTESEVIAGLIKNEEVIILEELDGWYKVEADGVRGYVADWLVSDNRVEVTNRNLTTQRGETIESTQTTTTTGNTSIVEYAKQYLGCPYVYGGSGPSSFDCSGFTMYVYKKFGISLPHTARGQSKYGTYVAKEDLQPGDIVFFKDYETMDGIGHCGIYIGNGDFIHASSGTGYCVKISTLLSGSYYTRYETARRLI